MRQEKSEEYETRVGMHIDRNFQVYDQEHVYILNRIDGVAMQVIITDDLMLLLVLNYEPFFREILAQIIRKAYGRVKEQPDRKAIFSVEAVKKEVFSAYIRKRGRKGILVIAVDNSSQKKGTI
jgi:hypothetical protein